MAGIPLRTIDGTAWTAGRDCPPHAGTAHLRQRRAGGSKRPGPDPWAGQLHRPGGRRDAGLHGDHLLYRRRLFRRRGDPQDPLYHPGGADGGPGRFRFCGAERAAADGKIKKASAATTDA